MIAEGWVQEQKHPTEALFIYNYTQAAQYERYWNEVTLACRGLILDENGRVIARPFGKFFNYEEHDTLEIPNENFEVYEKMDGSLGILYHWNGQPFIATRGSFASDQAKVANELLQTQYAHCLPFLQADKTYLFEIIYPENRVVVDYGSARMLVLLAIIDTDTGRELPLEDIGFPVVKKYDGLNDLQLMREIKADNQEGFVVRFKSGFRLKIKFAEYVRIHRIITNVSTLTIWEFLRDGKPLDELLESVPDEFFNWVRRKRADLLLQYTTIEAEAKAEFQVLADRKTTAAYFLTCKHPKILFNMLDNRDYSRTIWMMLRPAFEKPFTDL